MKRTILSLFTLTFLLFAKAQSSTAFAITGETKGNFNWTIIREIDLQNGTLVRNIYLPETQKPTHVDAATNKVIDIAKTVVQTPVAGTCNCMSQNLSAATAYDAKQNRLYFANLFGNDLQYINLSQKELKIYHVRTQLLKQFASEAGEGDNISRMVINADGYGYALTNNGNHLIQFSTAKNATIKDLGSLKDGSKNGDFSVHASTAAWGGDMIADAAGNLYLFTVGKNVFKINVQTLTADYLGAIKNLPAVYSVNAAAVDKKGAVIVSSSLDASNYFSVNLETLEATSIDKKEDKVYNASDFANGNFAFADKKKIEAPVASIKEAIGLISVYPNPVKNKTVNVVFNSTVAGKCTVELTELSGKRIAATSAEVSAKSQYKTLQLPASTVQGMYLVNVLNAAGKNIYSTKVVVE